MLVEKRERFKMARKRELTEDERERREARYGSEGDVPPRYFYKGKRTREGKRILEESYTKPDRALPNMASDAVKAWRAEMRALHGPRWFEVPGVKDSRPGGRVAAKIKAGKGPRVAAEPKQRSYSGKAEAKPGSEDGLLLDVYHFGKKAGTFTWDPATNIATLKRRGHPPERHPGIDKAGALYWLDMMRGESFEFRTPEGSGLARGNSRRVGR